MNYEDLAPELIEKAKACTTAEELAALAAEEGIELTEEQLDALSGGKLIDWDCPFDFGFGAKRVAKSMR